MSLFPRQIRCECCQSEVPRAEAAFLERCDGRQSWLCPGCLSVDLGKELETFTGRGLAVRPVRSCNTYEVYDGSALREHGFDARYRAAVEALLPDHDARCVRCGSRARFAFAGDEIYRGDPFGNHLEPEGHIVEVLCDQCLTRELANSFGRHMPTRVVLPCRGDGIWTSTQR